MLNKTSGKAGGAVGSSPPAPGPGLMGHELASHSNGSRPSSLLLLSPRSLTSLFSTGAPTSPTSMLHESKNQPRSSPRNPPNGHSHGAGLAAVLVAGEAEREHRANGRVLLGMRLRVQLPPMKGLGGIGCDLPSSPIEFGVKNRDSQLALLSPVQRSPLSSSAARAARSEVEELAEEDYTCVIARGPNPKMTHIFDDRVVESCAGDDCCQLSHACYGCKKETGARQPCSHLAA
ncbi:hypothetical protein QYE76_059360 [Lolium multiflorum]|uniref:Uncharacterized protein n=1 Tax=Lolium multiflorum TaxID=4521 RepID=A0AAD8W4F2_LOLMU|nr:hypothetical protein QYE76_059360 [Lolium multiflorum]